MSNSNEIELPYKIVKIERSPNNRTGVLVVIELEYKDDIEDIKRKIERGEIKLKLEV